MMAVGEPLDVLQYVIIDVMLPVFGMKLLWNAADRMVPPTTRRRGASVSVIQESGPGDVQEVD